MKQYKKTKSYKLGLNINIDFNIDMNYNYYIDYKRHGLYFSLFLFNNSLYICKGYYNNNTIYSHWKNNYQQFNYRYFL